MQVVDCRDTQTLLPIIQAHTLPGSVIHSDQWAAYSHINQLPGLSHHTVNHSRNFVDPVSGVHTQAIESYWGG